LGIVALMLLAGCAASSQPLVPAGNAIVAQPSRSQPARQAAREELGPETADQLEVDPRPSPRSPEPGADVLIDAIVQSLPSAKHNGMDEIIIGLAHVRNLSRSTSAEFEAFRQRLAQLLSGAGESHHLTFVAAEDAGDFELLGTAYLITAEGFDQWEVYLRLSPADASWTLWQPAAPLRVLRQPRPGQPQITRWPLPLP
jgi:hypothetical protein